MKTGFAGTLRSLAAAQESPAVAQCPWCNHMHAPTACPNRDCKCDLCVNFRAGKHTATFAAPKESPAGSAPDVATMHKMVNASIFGWPDGPDGQREIMRLHQGIDALRDRLSALERELAEARAKQIKLEQDLELALGPRDKDFTTERLLYLIRQDFDCLPECDSYGHAENCPYVGGPAQLNELTRQRDDAQSALQSALAIPREPTEAMFAAVEMFSKGWAGSVWIAMYDAALAAERKETE